MNKAQSLPLRIPSERGRDQKQKSTCIGEPVVQKNNIPIRQQSAKEDTIFMKKCKLDCNASKVKQKRSAQAEVTRDHFRWRSVSQARTPIMGFAARGTFVITEVNPFTSQRRNERG